MGLGNRNNNNSELVILRPVFKEDGEVVNPFFRVTKKVDGKWQVQKEKPTSVWGNLTRVEVSEEEYKGNKFKNLKLYIEDNTENMVYLLDTRFSLPARWLMNSLLNLESYEDININLYLSKNEYGAISVWQNDEMVKGKYNKEEIPEAKEVVVNGNKVWDRTEVDGFFVEKMEELKENLQKNPPPKTEKHSSTENDQEDVLDEEDDIPF